MEGYPFPQIQRSRDPLAHLCEEQAKLGWDKFLYGFVSRAWATEQERYWDELNIHKCAKQWYAKVIRLVWEVAWDLWLCRNKAVHEALIKERSRFDSAITNARLSYWYKRGNVGMENRTRGLWDKSLATLLQRSQTYKLSWLDTVETVYAYNHSS